ncbi:MAG: GAF domain-containing protein [bacterium]|nr:GAF domain-containing protein [bacterium]
MGRAYKQKEPQLVADVRNDPNYISYDSATLSELAVPILLNGEVIGVINVEHPQAKTFDTDDQRTLMTLAAHAAVVIEKARRYQELRDTYQALQQTHRMMEARTAVACLGMASSIYGHDIVNRAIVIREQLHLLQKDLQAAAVSTAAFQHRLDMIARSADRIRNKPLTLPLGAEESMEAVLINDLVGERARQLWQNDPYRQAELALTLDLRPQDSVWASAEWLRRVLDILLENAVKAVRDQSTRRVVVETHTVENQIEIAIIDSGSGLPPDVQAKIGIDYIERTEDAEGLGMGLLMAHIIVQAYHGQLSVGYTGATGTCMRIRLPLFESRT